MRLEVPATGVAVAGWDVYVTSSDADLCRVSVLRGRSVEDIALIRGIPCVLVGFFLDSLLVSAGETLYVVSGNEARPVLRARPGNWFWHSTEGCGGVFVHEYGEPPTGIYVSEDLRRFKRVSTNNSIDPLSRHFRYIAFDRGRELLATTLGDGNVVRVATSGDCGSTWRPLYKGPWQFAPVLVEVDRWIFGFDSGIARGGVGIYDTERGEWSFTFLKAGKYRYAQFTSITKLGDYYVGSLGLPVATVVSRDLLRWYPLYVNHSATRYNHLVNAVVGGSEIYVTTGKELLTFNLVDVKEAFKKKAFLMPYGAYLDRARGLVYTLKRLPVMLKLRN